MKTLHDVRETLRALADDNHMLPLNWKAVCGEMADVLDRFQPGFGPYTALSAAEEEAIRAARPGPIRYTYDTDRDGFEASLRARHGLATNYELSREMVRKILERASHFQWTLQGFGMFRLNLGKLGRIHIWHNDYAVKNVSSVHTHPWHLQSVILSGRLTNVLYREQAYGVQAHMRSEIQTGEGGGLKGDPVPVVLGVHQLHTYAPGEWYWQSANEIHESRPVDGTVTLVRRPKGPDDEKALVYWPLGFDWVSAEPRPATAAEVEHAVATAMKNWEG